MYDLKGEPAEEKPMNHSILTSRLRLRPFGADDVQPAFEWLGDPAVMHLTPNGPDKDFRQTAARIRRYRLHQLRRGYSRWILIERASGRPIGDAGLLFLDEYRWIDFGYRLAQPFWGKGLATEAASAWVEKAFGELKLDRLVAIVHPENRASMRVLQKLGFLHQRQDVIRGMRCLVYALAPAMPRTPHPQN